MRALPTLRGLRQAPGNDGGPALREEDGAAVGIPDQRRPGGTSPFAAVYVTTVPATSVNSPSVTRTATG